MYRTGEKLGIHGPPVYLAGLKFHQPGYIADGTVIVTCFIYSIWNTGPEIVTAQFISPAHRVHGKSWKIQMIRSARISGSTDIDIICRDPLFRENDSPEDISLPVQKIRCNIRREPLEIKQGMRT